MTDDFDPEEEFESRMDMHKQHMASYALSDTERKNLRFNKAIMGGTFGPLHIGHMTMIREAMKVAEFLQIGVMSDDKIKNKKHSEFIPSFMDRVEKLREYMEVEYPDCYDIAPLINGITEPSTDAEADLIVISDEPAVIWRCIGINMKRRMNGLDELVLLVVPRVRYENGEVVSSTSIRAEQAKKWKEWKEKKNSE